DGEILGKPKNRAEAIAFIQQLSGKTHEVIGGYCLTTPEKQICFSDTTKVFFKKLSQEEIEHYVDQYQPYDKAGAYAIQEWIGLIGIEKIEGSYFNVVGLAMHKVYEHLQEF
ncbi:MAG: Maf family protein, partial [Chitinophagales bacterium]